MFQNSKRDSRMAKELRSIINSVDELGNTAIHYATQLWSQDVVRLLLENGANIGVRNAYEEVPVENILPETMEAFLNEFCMETQGDPTNKDFCVRARYDFLAPPREFPFPVTRRPTEAWSRARNGRVTQASKNEEEKQRPYEVQEAPEETVEEDEGLPLPETEVLWHMSQSKKHRHLLKHPVITSFLWLKWNRISSSYSKNLFFYFAFVVFVTAYIFAIYGGRSLRDDGILTENCGNGSEDSPSTLKVRVAT